MSREVWGCLPSPAAGYTIVAALRVGKREEQGGGGPHSLTATAAQAAVFHLTAEQLPNDRVPRGAKAAKRREDGTYTLRVRTSF